MICKSKMKMLVSTLLLTNAVFAQEKEILDMSLEELLEVKVVTATKRESEALKVAAIISVLTNEELAAGGAENLADGLRFVSGVTIRKGPSSIPQYNASIRGNHSDFMNMRTLFLIDGVAVRNANAGFDPGWIPLSMIKRVEIVKGPNSNLWGANAFGGVINIITKSGADLMGHRGDVSIGYQNRHDHEAQNNVDGNMFSGSLGKIDQKWDYIVLGTYIRANDSSENYTGHRYQDAFGKISYKASEYVNLSMRSLLSFDQNQIGITNSNTPIYNNFSHVAATIDVQTDADSSFKITTYLNSFHHDLGYTDALESYQNEALSMGFTSQYTTTVNELHALIGGFDFVNENGMLTSKAFNYSGFPPTVEPVGWSRKYQTTWGTYIQHEYLGWDKFHPTAGIRYDHNTLFQGALSPRVSLSYMINRNINLYGSIGRGFRAPVFNETHINGYGKIGNDSLHPEVISTYELGLKSIYANTQNSLAFFYQDIRDKIVLEAVDPNDPISSQEYRNVGESKSYGLEIEGSYNFLSNWRVFYNSTLMKAVGQRVERMIETKFVLGSDLTWNTWKLTLMGIQEGDQFYYNLNNSIPDDSKNRYFIPKQVVGNVELTKKLGYSSLAKIYVNNFTNLKYRQSFSSFEVQDGATLPGRRIGLELKKNF